MATDTILYEIVEYETQLEIVETNVVSVTNVKLDDCASPDDNTDLNASTSAHGLLLKLDDNTSNYLRGDGTWATPAGSGVSVSRKTITATGDWTSSGGMYYNDFAHSLGKTSVVVQLKDNATGYHFEPDRIDETDTNTVRIWMDVNTITVLAIALG